MQRISIKNMRFRSPVREDGISLIELLVSISLLTIAIGAITSMVISSMRSQQEVTADVQSQLNVRKVFYDMEKNIGEAKRRDSYGNEPIFENDLISFPSQNQDQWITYIYTDQHPGNSQPTIVRVVTDGMPVLPLTIQETDKQMINTNPDVSDAATVERVSAGAPMFSYYDENGNLMSAPVTDTRQARTVEVSFKSTVSSGHSQNEPTVSSTRISLRNF